MTLYYLGPAGTFTEQAALKLAARLPVMATLSARPSTAATLAELRDDPSAFAVVPYYNYLEGLVQESIDGVFETRQPIAAAQRVPIRFAIGGNGSPIGAVYSHPKALAQCSDYLARRYPSATLHAVASTAEAAALAARPGNHAAIARREALEAAGLKVLDDDIGNVALGRGNYTEFLLLGNVSLAGPSRRTMLAITPYDERVGLLAAILQQFAFFGINLAKIHSRPAALRIDSPLDPQMFYFETEGDADDPDFRAAVAALSHRFSVPNFPPPVTILGSYPLFAAEQP